MQRNTHRRFSYITLALAILLLCFSTSLLPQAEAAALKWKYTVETEHYNIHTNIGRDFLDKAVEIAERAYAGAEKRMDIHRNGPGFIKSLERSIYRDSKLLKSFNNSGRQYKLPDGIILNEWPDNGTTYELVLPDGRRFIFWKRGMLGWKIDIYLCRDSKELKQLTNGSPNGTGRGGWFVSEGRIAIEMDRDYAYQNLDNVIHEISHQVMNYIVYNPPIWLDEGLAMYAGLDSGNIYREGLVREGCVKLLIKAVDRNGLVPIKELIQLDYDKYHFSYDERLHYAQSWALVHFLLNSDHPDISGKLKKYLEELRRGKNSISTFTDLYDLTLLESELTKYIRDL